MSIHVDLSYRFQVLNVFANIPGGMQDYNYIYAGCMEILVELSCCKFPTADTLSGHWSDNKDAMIKYLLQAQRGQ